MAERNEQVLDRVRQELNQEPGLRSKEIFDRVQGMDPSLAEGTVQQFHARYVLPIKRELAAARGDGGAAKPRARRGSRKQKGAKAEEPAVEQKPKRRSSRRAAADGAGEGDASRGREQVRQIFLEFAREFAEAESRTAIVEVISKVDDYVERVLQKAR